MDLNSPDTSMSDVIHHMHSTKLSETDACLIAAWLIAKGKAARPFAEIVAITRPLVGRSDAMPDLVAVESALL